MSLLFRCFCYSEVFIQILTVAHFLLRCPWLEEIQLQDNRLEYIPPSIFTLKSLSTLDMSNNKLTFLPFEMWKAVQLKELNVAFNMLSELPVDDVMTRERSFSKTR